MWQSAIILDRDKEGGGQAYFGGIVIDHSWMDDPENVLVLGM